MNRLIVFINDTQDIRVFLNGELVGDYFTALPTQEKDLLTMFEVLVGRLVGRENYEMFVWKYPKYMDNFEEVWKIDKWFKLRTYIYPEDEELLVKDPIKFKEKIIAEMVGQWQY